MVNKKIILTVFVLVLSTLLPYLAAHNLVGLSSPEITIQVVPQESEWSVCDTFNINITVTNVKDLYSYRFTLLYDPTILDVLEVIYGGFLNEPPEPHVYPDPYTKGEVKMTAKSREPALGAEGNGTLARIKFKCIGSGYSELKLEDTVLEDSDWNIIPHRPIDGECKTTTIRYEPLRVFENYFTVCHDMRFSGCSGFEICANDVVLDLNGHDIIAYPSGEQGILCDGKSRVTIKNGRIFGFQDGIYITMDSDHVTVSDITIFNSSARGIRIKSSDHIMVANSTVSNSVEEGMYTSESSYITLKNNIFLENVLSGIWIDGGDGNNSATGNTITDNSKGLSITDSHGNTIINNTISGNKIGIYLKDSNGNWIHHNNFINNTERQASDGGDNTWNDDYPCCGNYWSDYAGVDKCWGENQNMSGSDGILDTPYVIDADNNDKYPLNDPWGSTYRVFDDFTYRGETHPVAIYSNSSITNFDFQNSTPEMNFIVNTKNTPGFCKVIIQRTLLDGAFHVLIDDADTPSILIWNKTKHDYTLIHFTYSSGTHNVEIIGEVPCDLNGDGKLSIDDLFVIAKAWGKED